MPTRRAALLVLVAAVVACKREPAAPQAIIEGRIIDNFGLPIRGAEVSIRDSAFHATTDDRGRFEVPYAPGSFHLRIEARSFVPMTRDLQVTQAMRYPLGEKMLIRIPDTSRDVVVFAAEDGYRPLPIVALDRRVVTYGQVYALIRSRCAIRSLHLPVPTLRGNTFFVVLPDNQFRLVRVEGDHVSTDLGPTAGDDCPLRPLGSRGVDGRTGSLADRTYILTDALAPATYCLIRTTPMNLDDPVMGRGHCFRWDPDLQLQWGSRYTPAPSSGATGQSENDDHTPNAGGEPVNCPLRNGVPPCTEECLRANAMWGGGDPAAELQARNEEGECYRP